MTTASAISIPKDDLATESQFDVKYITETQNRTFEVKKSTQHHTPRKEQHNRLVVERRRFDIQQEALKTFPGLAKQGKEPITDTEKQNKTL